MRTILLAAGRGKRLGPLGQRSPKCLVPVGGEPLLKRILQGLAHCRIRDAVLVIGYQKEKIKRLIEAGEDSFSGLGIITVENPNFTQGSLVSLWCGRDYFDDDLLIMDADVYFDFALLKRLIDSPLRDCFLLDSGFKNTGEEVVLMARQGRVLNLAKTGCLPSGYDLLGESVGFLKLARENTSFLKAILQEMVNEGLIQSEYELAYQRLVQKIPIGYEEVSDFFWSEVDFPEDLERLQKQVEGGKRKVE